MWTNGGDQKTKVTDLLQQLPHRRPVQSWQDVPDEQRIELAFDLFEFGFLWVQRKGGRVGFARLACAGQEIERQ